MKDLLLHEYENAYWKGEVPRVYGIRYTLMDEEAQVLKRYVDGEDKDDLSKFRDAYSETPRISFNDALKLSREDMHQIWGVKGPHRHQILS